MTALWLRLRLLLATTLFIAITTLVFTIFLNFIGVFNIYLIATLVIIFNLIQWLIAPKVINALYRVREAGPEYQEIKEMLVNLSEKSNLKPPKLMIAEVPIPNAFAYGSPLTGNMVAVTRGLLNTLSKDELEAVLAHEVGHLKHRDVQLMMFLSILPAIFYYIGYSLYFSSLFNRDRGAGLFAIGLLSIFIYYVLSLIVLWVSRIREYYADLHAVKIVRNGGIKLANALVKIVTETGKIVYRGHDVHRYSGVKALFIADPDRAVEEMVELARENMLDRRVLSIARRKVTFADNLMELFSTHPNTVKRIRRLLSYHDIEIS